MGGFSDDEQRAGLQGQALSCELVVHLRRCLRGKLRPELRSRKVERPPEEKSDKTQWLRRRGRRKGARSTWTVIFLWRLDSAERLSQTRAQEVVSQTHHSCAGIPAGSEPRPPGDELEGPGHQPGAPVSASGLLLWALRLDASSSPHLKALLQVALSAL